MDNNLLYVIAAFIVGVVIGLIIRSATARGRPSRASARSFSCTSVKVFSSA